jgi:uncharacterized protein with PhoU and TrkA domain
MEGISEELSRYIIAAHAQEREAENLKRGLELKEKECSMNAAELASCVRERNSLHDLIRAHHARSTEEVMAGI